MYVWSLLETAINCIFWALRDGPSFCVPCSWSLDPTEGQLLMFLVGREASVIRQMHTSAVYAAVVSTRRQSTGACRLCSCGVVAHIGSMPKMLTVDQHWGTLPALWLCASCGNHKDWSGPGAGLWPRLLGGIHEWVVGVTWHHQQSTREWPCELESQVHRTQSQALGMEL